MSRIFSTACIARTISIAIIAMLSSTPSWADPLDDIRTALSSGDPATLDQVVSAAYAEAEGSVDTTVFWRAFRHAFETSHPDRLATLAAWRRADPEAPLALTAEAIARLHLGTLALGNPDVNIWAVRPSIAEAFHIHKAGFLASQAIEADRRMISAYHVIFGAQSHDAAPSKPEPFLDALLEIEPARVHVRAAMTAYNTWTDRRIEKLFAICETYAPRVPTYDTEICLTDAIYSSDAPEPLREAARATVTKRADEEAFTEWRFHEFLQWRAGGHSDAEREWGANYHRRQLDRYKNPADWFHDAQYIGGFIGVEGYVEEAHARAVPAREEWLIHDPYDSRMIEQHLQNGLFRFGTPKTPAEIAHLRRLWQQAMVYGEGSFGLWFVGAALADTPDELHRILFNAVHSATSDIYSVMQSLALFDSQISRAPEDARDAMAAALKCPMVRLARLYDALCMTQPNDAQICSSKHPSYDLRGELLAEMEEAQICPEVAALPLADLVIKERLPMPKLDAFVAAYETGLD